jgi:hypothetical protein
MLVVERWRKRGSTVSTGATTCFVEDLSADVNLVLKRALSSSQHTRACHVVCS